MNWPAIAARAAQPPSVLTRWRAEREAQRAGISNQTYPLSSGTRDSQLYEWLVAGGGAAAGMPVNERTIMCVGAVFACVSLIGGAVAGLPLAMYQRTSDGRERVDVQRSTLAADLWWLLNEQPHPRMSAAVFWEYLLGSVLLHGDAFARIERVPGSAAVKALRPWHPACVEVRDDELMGEGRLVYTLHGEGKPVAVQQDDILHIPGIGFDGYRGLSPIRHAARSAVGIALAADEYQASFFANGARPDFALTTTGKLGDEQVKTLRDTWEARFGGVRKAHLPAVLTGGLDIKPLNLSHEDMQIIATRQFQVVDIARIFGVPPHMIGETDKASSWGTGIETMGTSFVRYTLQRHLTKIEQEINRKLFPRTTRWFAEFSVDGLQRADASGRSAYFRAALGGGGGPGWMTPNEIRRIENLPPIDGGNTITTWSANDASAATPAGQ